MVVVTTVWSKSSADLKCQGSDFGIGLERLMLLLEAEGATLPEQAPLDVYVANMGEGTDVAAMQMVQAVRSFGYSAERDYQDRKLKANLRRPKLGARFIITIGERELAEQTANLKNMTTGKEITVKLAELYTGLPEFIEVEEDVEEEN